MGVKDHEIHAQTKNESWRRLCGLQEVDVVGDEGQMDEGESTDDGREERREILEDHDLGQSRRGCPFCESATIISEMAYYSMVEDKECLEL